MFAFTPSRNAEREKERGNTEFKAKRFPSAIDAYTQAMGIILESDTGIEKDKDRELLSQLYSNRSAACAAYGDHEAAYRDAEEAIRLQPTWPKAYSRKGKALFELGKFKAAAQAFSKGLEKTVDEAQRERDKQQREIDALRKQTESQGSEYLRVMEENESLKRRIEDYELVFGSSQQKKNA